MSAVTDSTSSQNALTMSTMQETTPNGDKAAIGLMTLDQQIDTQTIQAQQLDAYYNTSSIESMQQS